MQRASAHGAELLAILERWVGDRARLEQGVTISAKHLGTLEGFPTSIAAFATDIPALSSWGTPYLFGPGSIHVAHRDDEHVSVAELEAAVDAYERIVEAILAHD